MKNVDYRLSVYSLFAKNAKKMGLKWVVAHGSEGFPDTIGRDLDCLCYDVVNIHMAVKLFRDAASTIENTKWIIEPNPIWGKRVLAISKNYEVAELHILWKLNSGMINCEVDWNSVDKELFPHCKKVSVFKSLIMPILGGSKKVLANEYLDTVKLPYSISRLAKKIKCNHKISIADKLLAYISVERNPIRLYKNMQYARHVKSKIPQSATTPIVLIKKDYDDVVDIIRQELNEVFFDVINGDDLSAKEINAIRAHQKLICLSKVRKDFCVDYEIPNVESLDLNYLISVFAKFNQEYVYV